MDTKRINKAIAMAVFAGSLISPHIAQAEGFNSFSTFKSSDIAQYLQANGYSSPIYVEGTVLYESKASGNKARNFFGNQIQSQPVAKKIYDTLRSNISKLKTGTAPLQFTISTDRLSDSQFAEQVQAGVDAFDRDYSRVFWVDFERLGVTCSYDYSERAYKGRITYLSEYSNYFKDGYISQAEVERDIYFVNSTVNRIVSQAKGSTYDKLKYFHDYIVDKVEYNRYVGTGVISSKAWEAVSGLYYGSSDRTNLENPVCEGYARAFKELCDGAGIPNILVSGESRGESHMWNYVQVDGKWYAIDVTWDDPVYSRTPSTELSNSNRYTFFMRGTGGFSRHINQGEFVDGGYRFEYPILSANDYNGSR